MTTQDKYQNNGKLERLLDGIQRKVGDIGNMVQGLYEKVTDLGEIADSIYDSLNCQHASSFYRLDSDDLLDDLA